MKEIAENLLLAEKSRELFGDIVHDYFCETVATALIGGDANKICHDHCHFNDGWFENYYQDEDGNHFSDFDYIVLIARKGFACFKTYMRILKKDISKKPKNVILLNSRTTSFFSYSLNTIDSDGGKPKKDLKILIFDDLLNKGRNISRIVIEMVRLGIPINNIYYAALGYHTMQIDEPKEDDCQSTWISQDIDKTKYWLHIHGKANRTLSDSEANIKIRLFLPESLANEEFLASKHLFLDRSRINQRIYNFNKLLHFSLVPYTDYMSYGRFNYARAGDLPLAGKQEAVKKLLNEDKALCCFDSHALRIRSCDEMGIDACAFILKAVHGNGFYLSFRVMHNPLRNELLFYPNLILPALNEPQLCKLYTTLFAGVSGFNEAFAVIYPAVNETKVEFGQLFDRIDFSGLNEEEDYCCRLRKEYVFEHMARSLTCVLSAVFAVQYIADECLLGADKLASTDNAVKLFSKNLGRYLGIADEECSASFLRKCISNYEAGAEDIFAFEKYSNAGCPTLNDLAMYYEYDGMEDITNALQKHYQEKKKDIEYFTESEKKDAYFYFSDYINMLSEKDESRQIKVPPIPTSRIVDMSANACERIIKTYFSAKEKSNIFKNLLSLYNTDNIKDAIYRKTMIAFESIVEEGIAGNVIYSEEHKERKNGFINMNAIQCGEMAIQFAELMTKTFGGWAMIRELRGIYLHKTEAGVPLGLQNIIRESRPETADVIISKIDYLYKAKNFLAFTMEDNSLKDEAAQSLLNEVKKFRMKCICG